MKTLLQEPTAALELELVQRAYRRRLTQLIEMRKQIAVLEEKNRRTGRAIDQLQTKLASTTPPVGDDVRSL